MTHQSEPDVELEISDLRAEQRADAPHEVERHRTADGATGAISALARRMLSRRRRLVGGASAIIGVALVLALALREYSAATQGATVGTGVDARSPAATLLYFVDTAPWGVLRAKGRVVDVNRLLSEQEPWVLSGGATTIDYSAPPYPPLHCVISNPPARSDTCPLITQYASQDPVQAPDEGRLLDLRATLTRLSAAQFSALEQATEGALATAATSDAATFSPAIEVAPGDHYLNAQGQVRVATQPLRATLRLTFDRSAPGDTHALSRPPCRVLCAYGVGGAWQAPITPSWSYTPVGGATPAFLGPFLKGNSANLPSYGEAFLQIEVHWDGDWRVSIGPYDVLSLGQLWCNDGALALNAMIHAPEFASLQQLGVGDAQGCVYSVSPTTTLVADGARAGLFFFRCGVLLAASVAAHERVASLPIASPAETQAAQTVAGQSKASSG